MGLGERLTGQLNPTVFEIEGLPELNIKSFVASSGIQSRRAQTQSELVGIALPIGPCKTIAVKQL